jgi:MoaA/NifB/PqqE/SkfB family radical SAM enzyme
VTAPTECRPEVLLLDLSLACNLRCTTCRCPAIDADLGAPVLPLDVVRRVIDEFVALGGKSVSIFGGEPLLIKYLPDVVKHAVSSGLRVTVTTNGMAATPKNSRLLLVNGLDCATVSVDGDECGHESIRGLGTFVPTMQGALNLLNAARDLGRADFQLDLHATISRANCGSFAGLVRRAAQLGPEVSVSVAYFSRLEPNTTRDMEQMLGRPANPLRNHWDLPRHLLVTIEDAGRIQAGIREMKRLAAEYSVRLFIDPALDAAFDPTALATGVFSLRQRCPVFETCLQVGPDGSIGSCPMLTHFTFGQFGADSLSEVWNGETFSTLRRTLRSGRYLPVCSSCCNHQDLM